jgi:hypothetical protein
MPFLPAIRLARELPPTIADHRESSGRGDKDVQLVAELEANEPNSRKIRRTEALRTRWFHPIHHRR